MSAQLLENRVEQLERRVDVLEQTIAPRKRRKFGKTLDEVRAILDNPVERTEEDIQRALSIVGIWEGPEDLSANFRAYLRGEKQ